jgi:hypothetical protein
MIFILFFQSNLNTTAFTSRLSIPFLYLLKKNMPLQNSHEHEFDALNLETLIYLHLTAGNQRITKDYAVLSTLAVTHREVRSAISYDNSKNILPVMGMVAIIEQLGTAYKRTDIAEYPNGNQSAFKKALYYFYDQDADNSLAKTLYGLRNGIVHNASFFSKGLGANQPNYIFTYSFTSNNVLTHAPVAWDGNFNNISEDYFTEVNPEKLLALVEHCLQEAERLNRDGKLEIILPGGKNELIFRYFKWLPIQP